MSKLSISQFLNMLNDMDSNDEAMPENIHSDDNKDIGTENNGIPLNLYDSNTMPASFLEELGSQNHCMVSENSINVFINMEQEDHRPGTFSYNNLVHCENPTLEVDSDEKTPYFDNTYDMVNVDQNFLDLKSPNQSLNQSLDLNNNQALNVDVTDTVNTKNDMSDITNNKTHIDLSVEFEEVSEYTSFGGNVYDRNSMKEQVCETALSVNTVCDKNNNDINAVGDENEHNAEEMPGPICDNINFESIDEQDNITNNENENNNERTGRKRIRDQSSWEKSIRKRRRQAGEDYKSSKGQHVPKRCVKLRKDCQGNCRKKCTHMFCREQIESLHRDFWALCDNGKLGYYAQTTERNINKGKKQNSKRKFTFDYFFYKDEDKIPVCKDFYLGVLNISDNRIRKFYEKVEKADGNQFKDLRGKGTKQRKREEDINVIRNHIESFPRIQSHYCRSSTKKEFLESKLSLAKMYELYEEYCQNLQRNPLKLNMYRKIFHHEYNIGFHIPKKDRCDLCEEMKLANSENNVSDELCEKYDKHLNDKILTKNERDEDRRNEGNCIIVSFDLENVFLLPKANVSNFFYKRKLSSFNLTAHSSKDGCAYNCIWHEAISGRGANDITSALVTILKDIKRSFPETKSFVLWSDVCVPQNKNSVMSFALKRFMEDNNIDSRVQKFGCTGHACVQEVDNIHSHIERITRYAEIYSPLALIRNLKAMRRRNPVRVIQMHKHNLIDFQKCILSLKFNDIPYTKVKSLSYEKCSPFHIGYKLSFSANSFRIANIESRQTRAQRHKQLEILPKPVQSSKIPIISNDKKKDITYMLRYMPEVDRQFYKAFKLVITE